MVAVLVYLFVAFQAPGFRCGIDDGERIVLQQNCDMLGAHGLWNEADFIRRIDATEFSMFVTKGGPGHRQFEQRYNPVVVAAMQRRYQQQTAFWENSSSGSLQRR